MVFLQVYEDLCQRAGTLTNPAIKHITTQISHERVFLLKEAHRVTTSAEWAHILAALKQDKSLEKIAIINARYRLEPKKGVKVLPLVSTDRQLTSEICKTLGHILKVNSRLTSLEVSGLNQLDSKAFGDILAGLAVNTTLKKLAVNQCPLTDIGCKNAAKCLQSVPPSAMPDLLNHPLEWLSLTRCGIGDAGVLALSELVNLQKTRRETMMWKRSLRDEKQARALAKNSSLLIPAKLPGLQRLSLTSNIAISDDALVSLANILKDDVFVSAVDLQSLPKITKRSGEAMLSVLELNQDLLVKRPKGSPHARSALSIVDVRGCEQLEKALVKKITQASVYNAEAFLPVTDSGLEMGDLGQAHLEWMDASEIRMDSEFIAGTGGFAKGETASQSRVQLKKMRALQQSLVLEKELRKAAEKRNEAQVEEVKRLRIENSALQEDLALAHMQAPTGKVIVDQQLLENVEETFSKFNTFLEALARLGITNTETLQKADKQKLQEILDSC